MQIKPDTHNSINKWNFRFDNLDWKKIYYVCHKTTVDTKLRWFQIRLPYRILPTNRFLFLRKIKTSEICDLCQNEAETLEHMFFDCTFISLFWQNLTNKFIGKLPHANTLQLTKELILFGTKQNVITDKPMNLFILCSKYYIYSCKFTNSFPNSDVFLRIFKYRYKIEKYYYENMKNITIFDTMWLPYRNAIESI